MSCQIRQPQLFGTIVTTTESKKKYPRIKKMDVRQYLPPFSQEVKEQTLEFKNQETKKS